MVVIFILQKTDISADTITKGLEFNVRDWDTYAEFFPIIEMIGQ